MRIPDRAIEAATAAYLGSSYPHMYSEVEVEEIKADVRKEVEAAAPWIAAQAVKDAALDLYAIRGMVGDLEHGLRWLVDRAGALRDGTK